MDVECPSVTLPRVSRSGVNGFQGPVLPLYDRTQYERMRMTRGRRDEGRGHRDRDRHFTRDEDDRGVGRGQGVPGPGDILRGTTTTGVDPRNLQI